MYDYVVVKANPPFTMYDYIRATNTETGQLSFIPFDDDNIDYQIYLQWVAAGNVAPVIQS